MNRHLLDALLQHAQQRPDAIALKHPHMPPRTWGQLVVAVEHASRLIANVAKAPSGVTVGRATEVDQRRIVYDCHNTENDVVLALACIASSTLEIAVDGKLPSETRSLLSKQANAELVDLASVDWLSHDGSVLAAVEKLEKAAEEVRLARASLVLWTSGTTSQPRGVVLSQRNLTTNAAAKLQAVPQDAEDHRLTLLSLAHAYARTCDMGTWLMSGCRWTLDYGRASLDRIDGSGGSDAPTLINCVPSIAQAVMQRTRANDPRLRELRLLGCGGAALQTKHFDALRQNGIEVIQGYGCTETSPVICSASPGATVAACVGPPVADCETRINDQRLLVRGPMVMLGYLDDDQSTADKVDSDGWLDTGDLVERQPDGQFRILGRSDDVIVCDNGFKVHPHAVEQMVLQNSSCEHAVLIPGRNGLILAVQSEEFDGSRYRDLALSYLPHGIQLTTTRLVPNLSRRSGELTGKGTPRRHIVASRFR
ncbi:AMP-binding protein [Rhodopirellula sallentina]|uniref:Long-chain fatty-acid-CoA ligase n=1 Tax=Rhodopirellula sallentina SM41 TaxID=1263870 RepID=M5U2C6_9BACT|nr:AMP-binding protein [Rhodopirellula sallentina]EMI55424.1 long-chain fatty-acid-CoA ligase [Rhodopirellula sallentina SM41]